MRRIRLAAPAVLVVGLLLFPGCGGREEGRVEVPGHPGATKTAASLRAERRAYDGAPPVIPHVELGPACLTCHTERGMSVPDLGFAPANPHRDTEGMGEEVRCRQCHVFRATDEVFVANGFTGLPQDLRPGERFSDGSPPVIPHPVFMRENCVACHTGPGAREEIRTSHPERDRCRQCHVEQTTPGLFTP